MSRRSLENAIRDTMAGINRVKQMAAEAIDPSDTGGAEETSMAMKQIGAMRHYLDGIEERIKSEGDMEEWYQNKLTKANDYLKSLYGYGKGATSVDEEQDPLLADENPVTENGQDALDEKTLTPAEKKKREEIAKAIERENPKMPMAKKMAIATATAKKVAESSISDRTNDLIERALRRNDK